MYSVFIADDEHIVLEGIRKKIDWDGAGLSFAGEATDGEIAFSMISEIKPDILITDIKMPFMDGLELSRLLKKIQPWIKIIILSGHDEFEYAKSAISIGVEDYILKPFTHEELLRSLQKVCRALDAEKEQQRDVARLKEELESSAILLKRDFLSKLVRGEIDAAEICAKSKELDVSLSAREYKVIISDLRCESATVLDEVSGALLSVFRNRSDVVPFFISPERFVMIVKGALGSEHGSDGDIDDTAYSVCEAVEHITAQNAHCTVVSAIGTQTPRTSEIAQSYQAAAQILEQSRFWSKSRIVSADDVESKSDGILSLQENDPLVERLKYAQKSEIDDIVQQQLSLLEDNAGHFAVVASYLFVDVIMSVSRLAENLGGDIREIMPEILQHSFVDNAVQSEDVFADEIRKILSAILDFRDSKIQGKYGDVILKAKEYILSHFNSQDTCLKVVADAVHLSPNHFSTIFSQECGTTFIEYLTNVRIEEAKRLLRTTDMRSSDIAYECGFSDSHYFSFIFKKTTGVSPRDFKNAS